MYDYNAKNTFFRVPLVGIRLAASGKLNSYAALFRRLSCTSSTRGAVPGLIVPTGIATDHSTRAYFEHTITQSRLVSLYDFENREAVFPGVHRSYKFCLLTLTGTGKPASEAEFAFFLHQAEQLKEPERCFTLSAEDFSLFNPNTRTCPIFRTKRDMEIARKMYRRAGVLWKDANDPVCPRRTLGARISFMHHVST